MKARPVTIGMLARDIRQGAGGWPRAKFAEAVNLSLATLSAWEYGRARLTTPQLQRILRHPLMKDLVAMAQAAGIEPAQPAPGDQEPGKGGTP